MNLLPVVGRELRVAARQPFTYSLRMLGVGALLAATLTVGVNIDLGPALGAELFTMLHITLFAAIWVLVPVLTADAISRERREGTLALLSLTALSFHDVAWAKMLAHGLRAFTLWLAVLPVLMLPLMAGGVGWLDFVLSALINFCSILLAMSAGLAVSSQAKYFGRALAGSSLLALGFLLLLNCGLGVVLAVASVVPFGGINADWLTLIGGGFALALNTHQLWQMISVGTGSQRVLVGALSLAGYCVVFFVVMMSLISWSLGRTWREEPPSARVMWWKAKLCTPVFFTRFFRAWMRRSLQRNPIGWLEQRTWSGRLVMWSWFAVVISLYSTAFTEFSFITRAFGLVQLLLAWALAGSIAMSASGSFRRERESGVLELLLVSPLNEWQIIMGRVKGLWAQFMPAILLLCTIWIFFLSVPGIDSDIRPMFYFLVTFASVPIIGLYFSLAKTNFLSAFLRTLLLGIVVPIAVARIMTMFVNDASDHYTAWVLPLVLLAFMGGFFAWRMHERLQRRAFPIG